jgi:hypothetical protein
LQVRVAPWARKDGVHFLAELDERAWVLFSADECTRLADAIVEEVRRGIGTNSFGTSVRDLRLPAHAGQFAIDGLDLSARTFNCLNRGGFGGRPWALAGVSIGELLDLRNFGAACLVDLLAAYEALPSKARDELVDGASLETERRERAALKASLEAVWSKIKRLGGAKSLRRDDPRFGRAVAAIHPSAKTLEEAIEVLLSLDPIPVTRSMIEDIDTLYSQLLEANHVSLEAELGALLPAAAKSRNVAITARYLGFDGKGGATLQTVGDEYGLTRERVRQIVSKTSAPLKRGVPYAPLLDSALRAVAGSVPASGADLSEHLQSLGICVEPFDMRALNTAAAFLGRVFPAVFEEDGYDLLLSPEQVGLPKDIRNMAHRLASHYGVANASDIAARIAESSGSTANEKLVKASLQEDRGVVWLDDDGGWLWFPRLSRNRMLNYARKILSLSPRISIHELRQGIARHHRMKGFAPPTRALRALFASLDGYRVDGDFVIAEPPPDPEVVLGGVEQTMVRVLLEHGPVLSGADFERWCVQAGVNRSTFYVYLGYWPIFSRLAPGLYSIRGAEVPPGLVEELQERAQRSRLGKVLRDFGWCDDQRIWIGYVCSRSTTSSGVVHIPAAMSDYLSGDFRLEAEDGVRVGTLVVGNSLAWGLSPFFRRRGGEPGDTLVLVIDTQSRVAQVRVGDESLLDQYQG